MLPREEVAPTLQWGLQGALALRPPNPQVCIYMHTYRGWIGGNTFGVCLTYTHRTCTNKVLFLLGQHLPALLEKTDRLFFFKAVYPSLVLLALESNVPQLQVRGLCFSPRIVWVGLDQD